MVLMCEVDLLGATFCYRDHCYLILGPKRLLSSQKNNKMSDGEREREREGRERERGEREKCVIVRLLLTQTLLE